MCGIGGIVRVWPASRSDGGASREDIPNAWVDMLDGAIAHRGPDGAGIFRDRATHASGDIVEVALVHRRLAILDRAGGHQPMQLGGSNAKDLLAVVFNGCIYNHRALRAELEREHGARFASDHSDTEVILHAWRAWGVHCLEKFDGMFALALWDRAMATLVLARDRAGEKPLFFAGLARDDAAGRPWTQVFSSSLPGVARVQARICPKADEGALAAIRARIAALEAQGVEGGEVDLSGLDRVDRVDLRGLELAHLRSLLSTSSEDPWHAVGGRTTWYLRNGWMKYPVFGRLHAVDPMEFQKLPAGKMDAASSGAYTVRCGPGSRQAEPLDIQTLDEALRRSVRDRLEADVPLGCFLSGGVDSSLIAHYAQEALREQGKTLRTFTMRMPDAAYDESAYARRVAEHLNTEHTELACSPDAAKDLVLLIEQLGQPFGDSSLLPAYWLCKAAREHVRVALSGEGGDELFAGYERYLAPRLLARHGWWLKKLPLGLLAGGHAKSRRVKLHRLATAARYQGVEELLAIFPTPLLRTLILEKERTDFFEGPGAVDTQPWRRDFREYLPHDLLYKADTASMSVALEVRCPMLSTELIDRTGCTPANVLMPGGERKGLLRALARRHLPADVVDRPKMGFGIPIGAWFRSDFGGLGTLLRDNVLHADAFPTESLGLTIQRGFVRSLFDSHMRARADHGQRLYVLLVLALWIRWREAARRSVADLSSTGR